MLSYNPIKQIQIKRLCDIAVKAKLIIFLVNVVIAAGGDHRQVRVFFFDALADCNRAFSMQRIIQHDHVRPELIDQAQKIIVEIH
jgi:hypothetical protein